MSTAVKAFVSSLPGTEVIESELIAFCKERLATCKYPRMVYTVDELPTTVTDKILRRELCPAPNPS
jgi:long-chain acyl-CoA synthetase